MKDQRRTEIKVGLTAIIAVVLMIWVISWAKNYHFFAKESYITVRFNSTAGLEPGDPVTINGVRKGNVKEILVDEQTVLVKMNFPETVYLKEDAGFNVMMLDLMGGKKVEIFPGKSETPLDENKVHSGFFAGDISTAVATLSSVQGDLIDVIKEVKITLQNTNKLIADEEFHKNIKTLVSDLRKTTEKVTVILDENRAGIKSLVDSGNELAQTADGMMKENRESVKSAVSNAAVLLEQSNEVIAKIDNLLSETSSQKNNIGKLLYDETLINDLKISLAQIKELTKILVEQLKSDGIKVDAYIF